MKKKILLCVPPLTINREESSIFHSLGLNKMIYTKTKKPTSFPNIIDNNYSLVEKFLSFYGQITDKHFFFRTIYSAVIKQIYCAYITIQ